MSPHWAAEFDRRTALYARLDGQLRQRTRFFAAAALVNATLAECVDAFSAYTESFQFLAEAGAVLESLNLTYAREIPRLPLGTDLDRALVTAEQARLQFYLRDHQAKHSREWEAVRRDLNGLLNVRCVFLLSRWYTGGSQLCQVVRDVRKCLGRRIDFGTEAHRVLIGLGLIERIRREGWSYASAATQFPLQSLSALTTVS